MGLALAAEELAENKASPAQSIVLRECRTFLNRVGEPDLGTNADRLVVMARIWSAEADLVSTCTSQKHQVVPSRQWRQS